jgi:hypothetical protein
MDNPKVGKCYIFVRSMDSSFEHTEFTRHADGSAGFVADGYTHVYEGSSDAWRDALEALLALGFEEIEEAKARGVVPSNWAVGSRAA